MPRLFISVAQSAVLADKTDNVLVVIELSGGNDGLNTLVPFEDDRYYKYRPTLGIPKSELIKLNDRCGVHPAMAAAAELFQQGKLAIVQGVGYPEPDRSHFRSMEIWQTASTEKKPPITGWLGRVVDELVHATDTSAARTVGGQSSPASNESHNQAATAADPALPALALTGSLPQALQAEQFAVPVIQQLEAIGTATGDAQAKAQLLRKLSTVPGAKDAVIDFVRKQAETTYQAAERLAQAAAKYKSNVMYPGDLGAQLRRAAQVISADLGVRLMYASQGGYDTHSNQAGSHLGLLNELSSSLAAFQKDLEQLNVADKVIVMVFSEFGRRVDENASKGTDHGAGSCMFLTGSKVKGGLAGTYPSLEKLGDGDLIHTVDFRSVYATVLDQWLGCPSDKLLKMPQEKLPRLDLIAS
jgi:uncharacterized protein (DUF1501 family)